MTFTHRLLRWEEHRTNPFDPELLKGPHQDLVLSRKTNIDRYHGGDLADEIAALVSLCLGIRAKSGQATRLFEPEHDPRGKPLYLSHEPDPIAPPTRPNPILPRVLLVNAHSLDALAPFKNLLSLTVPQAIALVRAARSYQEAMWIAEGAPETAWLLFVSALETAANQWRSEQGNPVDRLRASQLMKLEDLLLTKGDDAFVAEVAAMLTPLLGATKKFIDFTMAFCPEPPSERPEEFYQLSWKPSDMKKSLSKIYGYRSRALHSGIPFPYPMCIPPRRRDWKSVAEIPALTQSARGATWMGSDLPMFLHIFEYITRHALVNWWRFMIESDDRKDTKGTTADAPMASIVQDTL